LRVTGRTGITRGPVLDALCVAESMMAWEGPRRSNDGDLSQVERLDPGLLTVARAISANSNLRYPTYPTLLLIRMRMR